MTVPLPLFFSAIAAKGRGSFVSSSIIFPVIYFTISFEAESVATEGCISAWEIMIYLSMTEKTRESFFRRLSRIIMSFVFLNDIAVLRS